MTLSPTYLGPRVLAQRGSAANDDKAQRLHFDARSAEALLIYLACHGGALARDTLAELFWPYRSQERARTNLPRLQLNPYSSTIGWR